MTGYEQQASHPSQSQNAIFQELSIYHPMPKPASDVASVMSASPSFMSDSTTGLAPSVSQTFHPNALSRSQSALQTTHSYTGANNTLFVQLQTPPQTSPTYMGGSKERGHGALSGRAILHCTDKLKATQVRMKLKCVVTIHAPRSSQATSGDATTFTGLTPSSTSTSSREQVLVQIDHNLNPYEAKYCASKGAVLSKNSSGRLDRKGFYQWDFRMDIPEKGLAKPVYPNGFPGIGTYYPSSYVLESDPSKSGKREEWASVKWYLKFTLERPGLFRSNDRVIIPFIYLPPPPENVSSLLIRRQALSSQTQNLLDTTTGAVVLTSNLSEPVSKWRTFYFVLSQASLGQRVKRSLVDKMFGTKKPREERWAISLPGNPISAFPLRSIVPFVLTLVHSAGVPLVVHPHVSLIQSVQLRGRSNATHTQFIAHAKVKQSTLNKSGMQQWFGWVQIPKWCSPSFETAFLGLEYYLQVKPLETAESFVLQTIPLCLYCMPPRLMQNLSSATIRRGSRQRVGMRHSSISNIPEVGSPAHRVPPAVSPPSSQAQSPAPSIRSFDDPRFAGTAGIGRSHLPGAHMSRRPSATSTVFSNTPAITASHSHDHVPAAPARPVPPTPTSQSQATMAESGVEASDVSVSAHAPVREEPTPDTPRVQGPPVSETASMQASDTTAATPSQPVEDDGIIHDAGPLTQEQENAWTMDILANAMNEDDMSAGFDLPPSYFEATGIMDNEES